MVSPASGRSGKRSAGVLAVLFAAASFAPSPLGQQVSVERDDRLHASNVRAEDGGCSVTWQLLESEPNRGVIRHYASCGGSFAGEIRLLRLVAGEALCDPVRRSTARTVSWGRLAPDGAMDNPMSHRLAIAAFRSPGWDRAKGQARNGDMNGFVRALCNTAGIYTELAEVFRELGFRVSVSAVEKVLVAPAGELGPFPALADEGVRPGNRLPYDCQVWFRLEPAARTQP